MLKNFLILSFIYMTTLFLDVFTYQKKSKLMIVINNLIYGLLLSIFYGFSIGVFFSLIFINNSDSIWPVIISTIIFILIINLAIIMKYRDEKLILPNQYIIIFSLIVLILTEKYITKSIIKLLGLTLLLSFIFVNLITILTGNLDNTFVITIGIIIIFLLTITILYRVRINSFKQAVNQFLLIFNLVIIVFTIGTLRLAKYSEINSFTTWLDISLLVFSIVGFLLVALPLATEVYERFKNEFNQAYHLFWGELVKISGYNNVKKDIKLEVSDLIDGLNALKKEWKEGNKKVIIKRSIISLSLLVILAAFLYFLFSYGDNLHELTQLYIGDLYGHWSSLFKDESRAQLTLVLSIITLVFIYLLYKLCISIKNNHLVSAIFLQINRLIFVLIILLILTINLFSIELNTIILTIIIILFISLMLLIKIQEWFKKKGK
ncbi:hypothetical protein LCM23_10810 [Cytobacillus kochii]|uniref:hypothetical protein n=1 Tax=Cytobacillus kochii TaxID=859143 RepID=UPI001CD2B1E0|nr:hypothetical protein [Cytobacillus kochii]MCA1026586.1 hypothetical protein [Cytobacillus kochii]